MKIFLPRGESPAPTVSGLFRFFCLPSFINAHLMAARILRNRAVQPTGAVTPVEQPSKRPDHLKPTKKGPAAKTATTLDSGSTKTKKARKTKAQVCKILTHP